MKKILSIFVAMMLCLPMMQGAIKVHTIGDSTMAEYDESTTDKRGWGMYLGSFFDPAFVTVNNRGKSGADTRGFYTGAAYWPSVKSQMSAGDYLIIQFAHNDEGTVTYGMDNLEYADYCAANGLPAPSDARGTNPQTTYREMLGHFIDEARAMGVTPILVGPICRAYFNGNDIRRNGQHDLGDKFSKIENGVLYENQSLPAGDSTMSYVHAMREVGKAKNVPFINLTEATRQLYLSYGETQCMSLLFCEGDKTHTNAMGGNLVARTAAQMLKNAGILADHINIPTDISANPSSIAIGETYCGVPQNKEFLLTGYGLEPAAGNVTITATANLQVSVDKTNYASTAQVSYDGGSMFRKVFVRANYTEGGEQLDTVYVTSGEHVIAVPVSATAISLVGGAAISATWALSSKTDMTAVVEGPVAAELKMKNMMAADTKSEFSDGESSTITMVRFHNADASGTKTAWPTDEIDENANRYMDFVITAPTNMELQISSISLDIAAHSTSAMCYHINTGIGNKFTDVKTIAEKTNMTNKTIYPLQLATTIKVPAAKTLHVRVLPWHQNASGSGKYICVKNVLIEGQAFESDTIGVPDPEEGEEPGDDPGDDPDPQPDQPVAEGNTTFTWAVCNEAQAAVTSTLPDYINATSMAAGTGLTLGSRTFAANSGVTMTTFMPATSNAGNVESVMVEYAAEMKKGVTFTLKGISYEAIKHGTDGASYSWSYVVDGVESDIMTVSQEELLRDNNTSGTPALKHKQTFENVAGRKVAIRFYVSGFGNTKNFALSNLQLIGDITGEPVVRAFQNFKIDFRQDPYTVLLPEGGVLPTGVEVSGLTYNDAQHGVKNVTITVPVDDAVKFTIGSCQFGKHTVTVTKNGEPYATIDNNNGCDSQTSFNHFVEWTYNEEEAATLVFTMTGGFMPFFAAEATEFVPEVEVRYYDTDGKTLIGSEKVPGSSALVYKYGATDVTVPEGMTFRGWFTDASLTATKVKEGTPLTQNTNLYAQVRIVEVAETGRIYEYDMRVASFDPEEHELLATNGGRYNDGQHGWVFSNGNTLSLEVAGNALIVVGVCKYSATSTTEIKDAAGNTVGQLDVVKNETADGSEQVIRYTGEATTLTFYFTATNYIHYIKVYHVSSVPVKNEAGYYMIQAGDAAAFILALETAESGDKIFLPNGTYDLGEKVLTKIAKDNIAIIGESMDGTIIRNAPDFRNEGIGTTATILIPKNITNTYLQDLTLQNALDYYAALDAGQGGARAVALQDQGTKTICKNVKLLSYQDTYYSNLPGAVKYFDDCEIHGTVDFICGDGSVYFKNNLLYAEKRNRNGSGSDALTAANNPATDKGYVFVDCTIQSECPVVSLGRAWNGQPSVAFINALVDYSAGEFAFEGNGIQRWTKELMNAGAWPLFGEYNMHLADGTVLTPASNVVQFVDKNVTPNETREIETVLTAEQAAAYTMEYTLGSWAATAANDAAQVELTCTDGQWAETDATVFLVNRNGVLTMENTLPALEEGMIVRAANARGGFGKPATIIDTETGVENVQSDDVQCTKIIENGVLYIIKDGKKYNAQGIRIQ